MTARETSTPSKMVRLIMELRRGGIVDARVLGALERIPREMFVPATFADQAYENIALPIGRGQTVSQPLVVARMTEALEIGVRLPRPEHLLLIAGRQGFGALQKQPSQSAWGGWPRRWIARGRNRPRRAFLRR